MPNYQSNHRLHLDSPKSAAVDAVDIIPAHVEAAVSMDFLNPLDQLAVLRLLENQHIAHRRTAKQQREARDEHKITGAEARREAAPAHAPDCQDHRIA